MFIVVNCCKYTAILSSMFYSEISESTYFILIPNSFEQTYIYSHSRHAWGTLSRFTITNCEFPMPNSFQTQIARRTKGQNLQSRKKNYCCQNPLCKFQNQREHFLTRQQLKWRNEEASNANLTEWTLSSA